MTDRTTTTSPDWNISTRQDGEVLTAGAWSRGLHLHLLGVPPGFTAAEVEGWLRDLIGVAHETSREDSEPGAIPPLLHHALTGLLFSHGQLWNQAGGSEPCSFACVGSGREVAFGWVGEANVQVRIGDEPAEVAWVRVRDDEGRSAQAVSFDAARPVRIRLYWSAHPGAPGAPGATMVAEWPGVTAVAAPEAPPREAAPSWQPPAWIPEPETPPAWIPEPETPPAGPPRLDANDAVPLMEVLQELEAAPRPPETGPPAFVAHEPDAPPTYEAAIEEAAPELDEALEPAAPVDEDLLDPLAWKPPAIALDVPRADLRPVDDREASGGPAPLARRGAVEGRRAPAPLERDDDFESRVAPPPVERFEVEEEMEPAPAEWLDVEEGIESFIEPAPPEHRAPPPSAPPPAPWKPILPPSPAAPWRDAGDDVPAPATPPTAREPVGLRSTLPPPAEFDEMPVEEPQAEEMFEPAPPAYADPFGVEPPAEEPIEPRARGFMSWLSRLVPWKRGARVETAGTLTLEAPAFPPPAPPAAGRYGTPIAEEATSAARAAPPAPEAAQGFDLERLFEEPAALAHDVPGVPDLIPPPESPAAPASARVAPEMPLPIEERLPRPAPLAPPTEHVEAPAPPMRADAAAAPPAGAPPVEDSVGIPVDELIGTAVEHEPGVLGPAPATPPPAAPPARRRMPRPFAPLGPGNLSYSGELEFAETPPVWKRPWLWVVLIVALFAGGLLVGRLQSPESAGIGGALRSLGLGGARYQLVVQSRPPGAWIAVDGKDVARRTPATVDLSPGEHEITLSFSDHGSASFTVRGQSGDREQLDAPLWGSLSVYASDAALPVSVSVDGEPRGFAPLMVDSLLPGTHEVRFSGPGMPSWGQTIEIRVRENAEVVARAMTSPATGLLEIRARYSEAGQSDDLDGAQVWVDGELRGKTPLSLELPRGPHSIRVVHQGETAPIQLIDLPGGNQRFSTFEFGLNIERPSFAPVSLPARIPLDQPTVVSAVLRGAAPGELREMWLHVRNGDGTWRRSAMTMLKAPDGVVGVGVFPLTVFDAKGRTSWYASAATTVGDEYYTEILSIDAAPAPR
jgi:hypothetical protein